MSVDDFEIIPISTFDQIEEWATPEQRKDPISSIDYFNLPRFIRMLLSITNPELGFVKSIGSWTFMSDQQHPTNELRELGLGVDISKELRMLGCPEPDIKRWALLKKIERETGKRCDDYV